MKSSVSMLRCARMAELSDLTPALHGVLMMVTKQIRSNLKKYLTQWDDLQAGRTPHSSCDELDLRNLMNRNSSVTTLWTHVIVCVFPDSAARYAANSGRSG